MLTKPSKHQKHHRGKVRPDYAPNNLVVKSELNREGRRYARVRGVKFKVREVWVANVAGIA